MKQHREVPRLGFATRYVAPLACLLFFTCAAYGQRGSITGTIADSSGAAAPNATVDVKNTETGAVFESGTSSTGNYVVPVPAGTYEVTVSAMGFKKYVRQNVVVTTATDTRLDVTLELGALSETVTVSAEAPLLKTESGEMAHQLVTKQVLELPVITVGNNIRNPLQQIVLLPGTTFQNENAIVVNGMPANSQSIRIEGQDSTGNIWKIAQQNSQAGMEAIQEVAIQTSNFAAEFGQAAGGYFNYTMKSGTNQYHGSAYDYLVNEAFNAGLPFTDRCVTDNLYCTSTETRQHVRNRVRRNDFGFTFGGPVKIPKVYNGQDRTFFFANFEQYRDNRFTSSGLATVPTLAYRNGDFSNALCASYIGGNLDGTGGACTPYNPITSGGQPALDPLGRRLVQGQIYDPYTTRSVGGVTVRDPFPGNRIPVSSMDSVALAVQKLFPVPNTPGLINNLNIPGYSNFTHTTNYSFKVDQNLSSTIKISGYYGHNNRYSPFANGLPRQIGNADTDDTNDTYRLNYDQSIRPTLLLHIGVGWFQTRQPHLAPPFDQSTIGLKGYVANQIFPDIGGILNNQTGGWGGPGVNLGATFSAVAYQQKPTAIANLTWVRGNHTFKTGGEFTGEGYPVPSNWRVNGNFSFSADQTANPWQSTQILNVANPTGFAYASFLTGLPNILNLNAPNSAKLGYHSMGFYAQDSWKATRKFTLDYGLRYDYQTYMTEQYGRMQGASFATMNTKLGRPGAVLYGQTCNCQFSHNYPFAFGPRLGGAYQIDSKTVLRGGAGIQYNVAQAPNGVLYSAADYYQINPNGYGISPMQNSANPAANGLQGGNPYAPGNPYGNPEVVWPNLDQNKYPYFNNGIGTPGNPAIFIDPNNRPGRVFTWSIAVQREVARGMVVEAAYVGNRAAYFPAPNLNQIASNIVTPDSLRAYGIDFNSATDRALLTQQVQSAAVQARFPQFRVVPVPNNTIGTVPFVYQGFPATSSLVQALRPVPQWLGVSPWIGPPMGKTWYDALQLKVTRRYSHGLMVDANFTWAKANVIGSASDSTFFLGQQAVTVDITNFKNNKQVNQYVRPLALIFTASYTTPRFAATNKGMSIASQVLANWTLGAVLRYQNGAPIGLPASNNNLTAQLLRGQTAFGNSGNNYWNLTGQPFFTNDPNCGCFDPQRTQILNPAAFVDAPPGQWTTSAPFYNNFRWQRQPAESMSFARSFNFRPKDHAMSFRIEAQFQNVFNRTFLSAPSLANPNIAIGNTTYAGASIYNSGFGTMATLNGAGAQPRTGTLIGRFTF